MIIFGLRNSLQNLLIQVQDLTLMPPNELEEWKKSRMLPLLHSNGKNVVSYCKNSKKKYQSINIPVPSERNSLQINLLGRLRGRVLCQDVGALETCKKKFFKMYDLKSFLSV